MWSSKSNDVPLLNPGQTPSREVRQDLASAWDTVTKTKAALRHIENRLEAVPTSNAVLDSVMDTKKTLSSAARKVNRKDGRYLEDSAGSVPMVKSGSRSKSRREKSSRSPLRATTLESNIKKSSRVEFRDPLTSYRDLDSRVPPYLTASQLEAQRLLIDLNSNEVRGKEEESSRIIYERDKRNFHCLDDDSTRTTAVDDTVVKYLNDHSALDALHNSETLYKAVSRGPLRQKDADLGARGSCANPGYESDFKNDRPSEPSQLSSPSSTPESVMQKLEIMRKKQHDDKLEKLKERIRKQREQSEESAERERLLNFSEHTLGFSVDTATPTTKVRKVTAGPPAPTYKGFNPMETKIRTPDGKIWREDEFRSITRDLYQDFPLQLGESSKMKDIASDKTKEKKTTKPVRKVQKITRSLSPDIKPSAHLINAASWREGQKLVKMVLGPTPKVMKDVEGVSNERAGRDRKARAGNNTRAESDTRCEVAGTSRPRSSERPRPRQQPEVDHKKEEESSAMDAMNTHVLPAEVRGILDDLQLEAPNHDQDSRVEAVQNPSVSRPASRSTSPAKRKQDKGNSSAETQLKRLRHYDSEEVRQYIMRQQVERKKKQSEEKKAQKEAMEQRNKRLQELYRKQKEAFMKPRTEPMCQKRLQETFSKFVSEQAKLEEMAHHQPALEDKQPRSIYQPSGESDKENKGQERPLSASSSSDMSLSEPPQPLGRVDGLESSWMPADRLSPAALSAHPHSGGNFFSHLLKLDCRGLLQREYESPARKKETSFKGKHSSEQFPSSTVLSDYSTGSQKPTGQYKSKLDRIEALKATAASLSNRLESEAKKLAGAAINYGAPHTSEHDVLQPAREDEQWAKPISPPVRDEGENEFSATMRRILGASVGHTIYDDRLPGVGNLYEYKKPHEQPRPQSAGLEMEARTLGMDRRQGVSWEHTYKRSLETVEQNIQKLSRERKHLNDSHNSSAGSISEGPLPSEASLSEDESAYASRDPVKLSERLREREFCTGEVIPSRPIGEFQKEAEKYQPFQLQSEGRKSRAPWEELAKGSPHSVINIFTKNYQIYGKGGLQEGSDTNSPVLRSQGSAANSEEQAAYEDDFHSSQGSTSIGKKLPSHQSTASSPSSIQEELLSRKSYDVRPGELSPHSSGQRSTASSRSSASSKRRLKLDVGEAAVSVRYSPVDESSRASAHHSDKCSQEGKRSCLGQGLAVELEDIQDKESTLDDASIHSMLSLSTEVTSVCPKSLPDDQAAGGDRTRQPTTSALPPSSVSTSYRSPFTDGNVGAARPPVSTTAGAMRCSPGSLQQRITAELTYLDAIEESVRQLTDIEKTRGIALAQQESVSLAQILKAQQQRHEHELAVLKLNAEQELLATQRHLEESRHKAAQAHVESLQHFAQTRQEMLHESTNKMMTQQTEAVRLTADAARQIKEMTELACAQMGAGAGTVATASLRVATAVPVTALLDQQRLQNSDFMKQLRARAEPDRRKDSSPPFGDKLLESKVQYSASIDSLSESSRSKHHNRSSGSSRQDSPSLPSDRGSERRASHQEEKGDNSSVEEEVHTAADDSIQSGSMASVPDDKDSVSVATEYSLKFDESMTEDEIEEKSFRSLLPSESHRRFNMEKKRSRQVDSDEDATRDKSSLTAVKHELSMPFSGGQDSFSKFTMEMVRQYMKEEEMRAQHQVSLLKLREKALKEKTKAELAWLEHQRKRLRDKGEDDKMPPIRKRQRGLLLRLQQEQAEIKRLQEANKAARKERQLILKQQEEIQRMRQTTIKLQEKLKSAGEGKLELRSAEPMEEDSISKQSPPSSHFHSDVESRSPSPVSASGSETSSIMQKLKKMRSHMDEKFLTKREQKLMHRRRHAEELLEWKHRLDAEETEIRRMEKQALAAWDKEILRQKAANRESSERSPGSKDTASEEECPAPSSSHFNSDSSIPEEVTSPPAQSVESASVTQRKTSSHERSAFIQETYSQEFESVVTPSTQSPPLKVSATGSKQDGQKSSSSLSVEISPPGKTRKPSGSWSDESVSMTYSETASDQSDIESRIRALKAELRKRKSIVDQLKKEQRKRQKERLKAQEASLLKQLESYDEFIKKTQAELSKDLDLSTSTKPQIKTPSSSAEKPNIKPHPLQRSESVKSWKSLTESEKSRASLGSATDQESRSLSVASRRSKLHLSELRSASLNKSGVSDIRTDESSQSPSPVSKSLRSVLEFAEGLDNVSLSLLQIGATECGRLPDVSSIRPDDGSGDESVVSSHRSGQDDIQEELQTIKSEESEADEFHVPSQQSNESEPLLNLIDVKSHTPELLETLTQRSSTSPEDKVQSHTVNSVEQNVGDLQEGVYSLGKEGSADEEDGASDHSVSSVKSVKSSKSDASAKSIKSDGSTVNKGSNRNDPHPQEVSALSSRKEPTYSEDFESTPRKKASEEHTKTCVESSNSESLAAFSSRKEMGEHSIEPPGQFLCDQPKQEEVNGKEGRYQSVSSSIDSDAEISEHLSEKSFTGSGHSERLWELKSPTERSKNEERSDVGSKDHVPVLSPSPEHTSTAMPFETDELPTFQIGDRVLVSSVQPGTLHFKGQTRFANGFWAGVELDKPEGSNNGMYDGIVYFTCKDKHGIFAPPHKISHLPEGYEELIDSTEDDEESLFESKLNQYREAFSQKKDTQYHSKDEIQQGENEPKDSQTSEIPAGKVDLNLSVSRNDAQYASIQYPDSNIIDLGHIINESAKAVESFVCDQNLEDFLPENTPKDQLENLTKENFNPPDGSAEPATDLLSTDMVDNFFTKVSMVSSNDAIREKEVSPAGHEVSSTPLLDLLTREKEQLEAQLRASHLGPVSEEIFEETEEVQAEEEPEDNKTKASSLADNLLSFFVKETVKQLQDIKKSRNGKIHLTNEELNVELADESTLWAPAYHVEVQDAVALQLQSLVGMDSDDDREEPLSPDLCARPGSPVFGTSGQEELAKRLAELEWSRELLDDLGDEQDWFDEDFGLSSRKVPQPEPNQQPLQPAEVQKAVPQKVREEPYFAVPHNAEEVERMVHAAAEELWKWQELGQSLQDMHIPGDYFVNCKGQDIESVSKRVYYEAMFNLTREIFSEIFAEDPNATQPPWMKSSRMSSSYFRRVRNLQDMDEVKTFISNEVLKLFGFRREQNNKTDWQKMMKFGRKKRDRVDHILVQELHEEEAQWVNYDEDELCVKMQLADGIFEALIKDTIDVLNQIQEKRSKLVAS